MVDRRRLKGFWGQYKGVARIVRHYWSAYGGWWCLLTSPYFHAAIFFTFVTQDYWRYKPWFASPLSILPNLLGFSLAGFAIWLAFGNERFRDLMLEKDGDSAYSSYVIASSSFVHFVFVQFLALVVAIVGAALSYDVVNGSFAAALLRFFDLPLCFFYSWSSVSAGFGFLFFVYAILSGIAATFQVFRMVLIFEKVANHPALKR